MSTGALRPFVSEASVPPAMPKPVPSAMCTCAPSAQGIARITTNENFIILCLQKWLGGAGRGPAKARADGDAAVLWQPRCMVARRAAPAPAPTAKLRERRIDRSCDLAERLADQESCFALIVGWKRNSIGIDGE